MHHSQGLSNNPYLEPNHFIPRIDTHVLKIHSIIVLRFSRGVPKGLFSVEILKALLPSSILDT